MSGEDPLWIPGSSFRSIKLSSDPFGHLDGIQLRSCASTSIIRIIERFRYRLASDLTECRMMRSKSTSGKTRSPERDEYRAPSYGEICRTYDNPSAASLQEKRRERRVLKCKRPLDAEENPIIAGDSPTGITESHQP